MLTQRDLLKMIPTSRTTIWRWCSEGRFPKPVQLSSRRVVWFLDEVAEWQETIGKSHSGKP
ncbi:MAG: AlpA family phage regulatory protein [Bradyrhizobium sp.]|nr:AlpA family phage regulatory protein [Bradyrhizobium sp.]MDP1867586.1 AlpA family phage regulatory protein [Bradyrhizobium sp.]